MSNWNSKLIRGYRCATYPWRMWRQFHLRRLGQTPVQILFYHRVADDHLNPWTISRRDFERQIDWLQEHFEIVDLEECQRRIKSGFNQRPTLAITFDDGYAENCEFALPLLIERRIPATYFVTTYHPTFQQPFAHDVERNAPLAVNTLESLMALDISGIEIGAHTRHHVDLGKISEPEILADQVLAASLEMESLIGRSMRYFAFPFGQPANLNADVFAMLRQAGFLGVCSAYGGANAIGGDAFHLCRTHGDPSLERIKNWLTHDPRRSRTLPFEYEQGQFCADLIERTIREARLRNGQPTNRPAVALPSLNCLTPSELPTPS